MIFTFESKTQGFGSPTTTLNFEADQIGDVITKFKQFLKGCGYELDGDIVYTGTTNEYDTITIGGVPSFVLSDEKIELDDLSTPTFYSDDVILDLSNYGAAQETITIPPGEISINLSGDDVCCGKCNKKS